MCTSGEMQARHAQALSQLAELGLALAADLQRRALATADDAVAAQLSDSFHKVGRSVRQSVALEARLERDAARSVREAAAEDERVRPARVLRRKAEVRQGVERLIWTEVEASDFPFEDEDDAELVAGMVADLVMEEAVDEEFAETPVVALIERLRGHILPKLRAVLEAPADEPELRDSA